MRRGEDSDELAGDTGSTASAQRASAGLPEWLMLRRGTRPLVVIAPHGGRRRRGTRRGDSVNDLHTADLAWQLAERLDAHAIVNHGLDRNDIDLNRISHLSERAPQVLALLRAAVEGACAQAEAALVLFVHGWNAVLPCCDIGIGLRRHETPAAGRAVEAGPGGDGTLSGRFPTLRRSVYDTTVAAIERSLGARGITAAIGRRYAASGRDNAAQLFSGRHDGHAHPDVARLAHLALAGRADAAQLELGIALRWPGPRREALLDALVEALSASTDRPPTSPGGGRSADARSWQAPAPQRQSGWILQREAAVPPTGTEAGYALHALVDAAGQVALFAAVEATGAASMAGRLCIVVAGGPMLLATGEGPWSGASGDYEYEGFRWRVDRRGGVGAECGVDIEMDGPMVRYTSHDAYLDLEEGLADSELVHAHASLRYDAHAHGCGRLRGSLRAGELRIEVDTVAFLDRAGRWSGAQPSPGPCGRVRLLVAAPGEDALRLQSALGGDGWLALDEECTARAPLGRIRSRGRDETGSGFSEARIVARVPVSIDGPGGSLTRRTFGIAACRFPAEHGDGGEERPGLFDVVELLAPPRADSVANSSKDDS